FFQAEDGIRDKLVTGVQTCALPILRGARHWAHLRATDLYAVGSFDPDHDAVMRIGVGLQPTGLTRGEAPGGGSILSVGLKCHVRIRLPAPSDRQFGSHAVKASANAKWC